MPAAFKYYLQQKELWNTKSIDDKLAAYNNVKSSKRKSHTKEEVVFSNNAEEEHSEEQQSVKQDDDKEQEADDFEDDLALNLTFNESNWMRIMALELVHQNLQVEQGVCLHLIQINTVLVQKSKEW